MAQIDNTKEAMDSPLRVEEVRVERPHFFCEWTLP